MKLEAALGALQCELDLTLLERSAGRNAPAEDTPMLGQSLGIGVSEIVQQPHRALDVGEEEGAGARREDHARGSIQSHDRGLDHFRQLRRAARFVLAGVAVCSETLTDAPFRLHVQLRLELL